MSAAGAQVWSGRLRLFIRFQAVVMGAAIIAVFMPMEWMEASNRSLGLEPLPRTPLVEYLARSLSALYALFGCIGWVTSRDVHRFAPVITYVACGSIALSAMLLWIDLSAGMPFYWTLGEAVMPAAGGSLVLILQRLSRSEAPSEARW